MTLDNKKKKLEKKAKKQKKMLRINNALIYVKKQVAKL